MNNCPIKSISCIFNSEDASSFIARHEPFVLKEVDIGTCTSKWNVDYLKEHLGREEVKIHVSQDQNLDFLKKNFMYKTLCFEELLERASLKEQQDNHYFISKTEYYYLRSVGRDARKDVADIKEQFPVISKDLMFPSFIPEEHIFSSIFRIASEGVSIWTHYDVMDNALIQIKGRKRAVLFPPTDVLNLYMNGDKSEVTDIENPDLVKFPKFKDTTRYECCLNPGDILYIPALWFHTMKYLDFGIAVNVFWKELEASLYDRKDPYGNRDHLPAQQAFASLDRTLSVLSKLPPEYKHFYCLRLISHIEKKMKS